MDATKSKRKGIPGQGRSPNKRASAKSLASELGSLYKQLSGRAQLSPWSVEGESSLKVNGSQAIKGAMGNGKQFELQLRGNWEPM